MQLWLMSLVEWGEPRLIADPAYPRAHVQLNIAALLETGFERLLDDRAHDRASSDPRESVHLGSQRVVSGQRRSVDEALDVNAKASRKPAQVAVHLPKLRCGTSLVCATLYQMFSLHFRLVHTSQDHGSGTFSAKPEVFQSLAAGVR
jgi:hypothetical protein